MKLRVTKPNLYHRGNRKAVGDIINVEGDKIPTVFAGKVEPINETGLTTDKEAGGDVAALQDELGNLKIEHKNLLVAHDAMETENANLREENSDLKARNEALEAENADLKANEAATLENRPNDADTGTQGDAQKQPNPDTSAEADAKRKAWLIDEIEKLTGERPGTNSKLETLETKFEKAKLADEE